MPVLDPDQCAPRSALRYRPIQTDQAGPNPVVSRRRRSHPDALITSAKVAPDENDLENEMQQQAAPRRTVHHRRRFHPLFWLVVGALALLLLWWGLSQLLTWGNDELDTIRFGYPRTFQVDAVVGQGDSAQHPSHFVAINLRGNAIIIDFPGGDPSKARTFQITGMLGPNSDLDPITLNFVDVNHNGRPDMIVDMAGIESVLVNDQGTFRPPTPAEQQEILNILRQQGQ